MTNIWLAALTSGAVLFITAAIGTPSANLMTSGQPVEEEVSATDNVSTTNSSTLQGSVLKLSNANVELDVPMMKGYENGNEIFFIATDSSDNQTAIQITNATDFKVNFAPLLAKTPEEARGQAYVFENGVEGEGPLGFQLPVINARPGQEGYSPLLQINLVRWNQEAAQPSELRSEQDIIAASNAGQLTITKTDVIVNHPAVKWQGGSLQIRQDRDNINDESPYMGGQVTNIDTANMTATFVAHRGWGPDGKTVYYIVTDAVPEMPASMMGVSFVPADEKLIGTPVAPDLFQFTNGINGTGPMGFQSGIGSANPDDDNYSPMWKISFLEWKDPSQAKVLQNLDDINMMLQRGLITLMPAMEGRHIVNCPFFDEETISEHQKGSS